MWVWKMGLLDFIEAPIEGIIHDLTTPIEEVTRLFGVVISAVKDIIQDLISLLSQIENLFNANTFVQLFVQPFESGLMAAISGIDTLTSLIFMYGEEGFSDIGSTLSQPIKDAYSLVKQGVADLRDEYTELINEMHTGPSRMIDDSIRELHSAAEKIDDGIALIQQDIGSIFTVIKSKASSIIGSAKSLGSEFITVAKNGVSTFSADINKVGSIAVDDLKDLKQAMQNRMKNESGAIDALFMVLIGSIVVGVFSFILMTKSVSLLIAIVVLAVITFISFYIF